MLAIRVAAFLAWVAALAASLGAFVYLIGFIGNRYTFSTIDSGLQIPAWEAARVDLFLLLLFGAQHSLMARRVHRTVYLLATAASLALIFIKWEPMPEMVWQFQTPWPFAALFCAGWALVVWAAASMHPLDTFGARQAWAALRGVAYRKPEFKIAGPYRWRRHPMMLGLLVAFWATAEMSVGHLLFAAMMTVYILAGIRFEERALRRDLGERYDAYRKRARMLF